MFVDIFFSIQGLLEGDIIFMLQESGKGILVI